MNPYLDVFPVQTIHNPDTRYITKDFPESGSGRKKFLSFSVVTLDMQILEGRLAQSIHYRISDSLDVTFRR